VGGGRREGRRRDIGASGEALEMGRAGVSAVRGALESISDEVGRSGRRRDTTRGNIGASKEVREAAHATEACRRFEGERPRQQLLFGFADVEMAVAVRDDRSLDGARFCRSDLDESRPVRVGRRLRRHR
jgi:hypothetical protein